MLGLVPVPCGCAGAPVLTTLSTVMAGLVPAIHVGRLLDAEGMTKPTSEPIVARPSLRRRGWPAQGRPWRV